MIFEPRREAMDSAVFASVAESFTFFAVKIRLICGEIKPSNRKVRHGLRKGRKGNPRYSEL